MLILILTLILMTLVVITVLVFQHNKSTKTSENRRDLNLALFNEHANSDPAFLLEKQTQLLSDLNDTEKTTNNSPMTNKTKCVLALFVIVLATGLYAYIGNYQGVKSLQSLQSDREEIGQIADDITTGTKTLPDAIKALQAHVQKNPQSVDGWYFLGQVAMESDNLDIAKKALIQAKNIAPTDPTILFALLQVEYMQAGHEMTPETSSLAQRILALEPQHEALRNLLAVEAMKKEDWKQAMDHLHALLPAYPADTERGQILRTALSELQERVQPENASIQDSIRVSVTLNPKAAAQVNKDDLVFIALKRLNGPPMPLRVVRTTVAALSQPIVLDAKTAMMNSGPLPVGEPLNVIAHVSKSGIANRQPGDWMGEMRVGDLEKPVLIQIDRQYQKADSDPSP